MLFSEKTVDENLLRKTNPRCMQERLPRNRFRSPQPRPMSQQDERAPRTWRTLTMGHQTKEKHQLLASRINPSVNAQNTENGTPGAMYIFRAYSSSVRESQIYRTGRWHHLCPEIFIRKRLAISVIDDLPLNLLFRSAHFFVSFKSLTNHFKQSTDSEPLVYISIWITVTNLHTQSNVDSNIEIKRSTSPPDVDRFFKQGAEAKDCAVVVSRTPVGGKIAKRRSEPRSWTPTGSRGLRGATPHRKNRLQQNSIWRA